MRKLTEGNITKQILLFMFPILIGNGLQRVYTLVDTMMVGRILGSNELAAVGAAGVITMLLTVICNGLTSGFSIVIGQAFGEGSEEKLKKALGGTYTLSVIFSILLTIGGLLLIQAFLKLIQVPAELWELSKDYLFIMTAGITATLVYNLLANVLRAIGDSKIPLVFLIFSVVLNIILDFMCIKILGWGIKGAAAATVFSQSVAAIGCIIYCVVKRPQLAVRKNNLLVKKETVRELLPQGFAMCLMLSFVAVGTVILQRGINSLGTDLIAGYVAGRRYLEILMMPGAALSMTAATYVSQNYGAKEYTRIKKGIRQMILMSWTWSVCAILIVYTLGKIMITSVTGNDVEEHIIQAGITYLRISVPLFFPLKVLVIIRSSLQGMNHKKTTITASIMELIVKVLAVIYIIPKTGYIGVCITEPIIWILGALWLYPMYKVLFARLVTGNKNSTSKL